MDILSNKTPTGMFINKKIYMLTVFLVIVGGLNWLVVGFFGMDPIKTFLGRRKAHFLYVVVGIAAILLALRRDVYLPFLGQTVFPSNAVSLKTPQGANDTVSITTLPGAKVVYWAAEPTLHKGSDTTTLGWDKAYGEFENSGVVKADDKGIALLRIRGPPQAYSVPMKGTLKPHVHFRIEEEGGFFGRVKTVYLDSGLIEGFSDTF